MNKYNKLLVLVIMVFGISFHVDAGGPWTKNKGKYYFKLSEWFLTFDEHYTDNGNIDPNITTSIYNTFLYAEYGITDRLTGVFNGAIYSRNVMNNQRSQTTNEIIVKGDALNSIGDIDVTLKYRLSGAKSSIPVALSLQLGIPTGATGKGEFGNLQTGDGEFNQLIQLDAGKSFALGSSSAYISSSVAFNNRTKGFSDEYRLGAEIGLSLADQKLWLSTKLSVIQSFRNGDLSQNISSTSIFANNTEFTSLGFEASYFVTKKIGVSANYTAALSGRIIAAAPSYSFGVFMSID